VIAFGATYKAMHYGKALEVLETLLEDDVGLCEWLCIVHQGLGCCGSDEQTGDGA
jgi:hypothetical protein